jgi:hypothetical protein
VTPRTVPAGAGCTDPKGVSLPGYTIKRLDDVFTTARGAAVRVAPEVARSVWNDEPEDAELVIVSVRIGDPRGDAEQIENFWPR